jgi:hypothetical protein
MSLALSSKLAKLNQSRYPFLAREFEAKKLRIHIKNQQCSEGEHLSLSVVFRAQRTNHKPKIPPLNHLGGRNSRLIIVMCPTPYCCTIRHPLITSLDAVPDSAHIRSTGLGEV